MVKNHYSTGSYDKSLFQLFFHTSSTSLAPGMSSIGFCVVCSLLHSLITCINLCCWLLIALVCYIYKSLLLALNCSCLLYLQIFVATQVVDQLVMSQVVQLRSPQILFIYFSYLLILDLVHSSNLIFFLFYWIRKQQHWQQLMLHLWYRPHNIGACKSLQQLDLQ